MGKLGLPLSGQYNTAKGVSSPGKDMLIEDRGPGLFEPFLDLGVHGGVVVKQLLLQMADIFPGHEIRLHFLGFFAN